MKTEDIQSQQQAEPTDREKQLNLILKGENNEQKDTVSTNFRDLVSGEILTYIVRKEYKMIVLVLVYTIFYIGNRYTVQQQLIDIDRLEKKLTDVRYNQLTRSSELTEMTRQSRIEEFIRSHNSELETATYPPFLIKKTEE